MSGVHTIWQGGLPACFAVAKPCRKLNPKSWTVSEDRLLRERYPKEGAMPLVEELGRTARAISERARALHVRMIKPVRKPPDPLLVRHMRYTDEDIEFLRANFQEKGVRFCARKLARPERSVADKARDLGLISYQTWSREEDDILRKALRDRFTLPQMCDLVKRGPRSVWNRLRTLGLIGAVSAAALAGCSASKVKEVPVYVPCRVAVPSRPVMPTETLSPDVSLDDFIAAATAEIERREGYELELRAVVESCQSP